jgi:membrane protease YdiL (CAAX protease family)
MPILGSAYHLRGSAAASAPSYQGYRLWGGLISEASGLLVLWYVMRNQGKRWKDIGWNPSLADVPRAIGLFLAATVATWAVYIPTQYLYRAYSGEFLTQKSLNSTLAFGISALSITFVCINPFFEELIVRAYTISELIDLGANRAVAIAISVALQASYHLYQGLANVLVLIVMFTVVSIYYSRTRRIVPVFLVHLGFDLFWLFKANL